MSPNDLSKFASGIATTGFVLENRVVNQLKSAGWSVISNRYYEDDREGTVREIDVLAYRVTKLTEFEVYTCLIVSCKKSEKDVWCFLSRDLKVDDPNANWWPVHAWSNVKSVTHQLSVATQSRRYHSYLEKFGLKEAMRLPEVEVFAFQEMSKAKGSAQNQTNIFAALTGLLKAQAYEIGSLPKRKAKPCVYQFNLLSIVDSEIVRLNMQSDPVSATEITSEHLISSYIIKGQQSFSRIRFLSAAGFVSALPEYQKLHELNSAWFETLHSEFYVDIVTDRTRAKALADDFKRELHWSIAHRVYMKTRKMADVTDVYVYWNSATSSLSVVADGDLLDNAMETFLQSDESTLADVAKALRKIYRYSGEFKISTNDIPF